ncbi:cytochrome P450 [Kitasatospora sp. NPDC050543]|uniref:cytochrome P450 n=1 Tax=Kitasatospora sp. NPDC050543 TaxID=3364054 RepID=UPI0037965A4C
MPVSDDFVSLGEAFLADPHGSYALLHPRGTVHRAVTPDAAPVWLITGYREVRSAAADPRLALDKRHARTCGNAGDSLPPELDAHLLNTDGPDHTRLRRLVTRALGPRRIGVLREQVQQCVDRLLDALTGHRRADIVADLAAPLSMTVICDLLGVPDQDRVDFRTWTDSLLSPTPDAPLRSREAMRTMCRFLAGLIADKRAAPGNDLLSELIAARDDGDRLGEDELLAMAFLLLFAGYHNVVHLVSSTVLALLTHPDQAAALRSRRLTMHQVTDEVLRWNPPGMLAVRRFAVEEIEIGGTTIGAGERVWLSWAAANRDPQAFGDPEVFAPVREPVPGTGPQLAFGHGPHYCVGAALAGLENEIAIGSLLRRFPGLALVQAPDRLRWVASLRSRGLTELRVTL